MKISYTVPLDQVPAEVLRLFKVALQPSEYWHRGTKEHELLESKLSNDKLPEAVEQIDTLRQVLAKMDVVLEDCQSILVGYQRTKAAQVLTSTETLNADFGSATESEDETDSETG